MPNYYENVLTISGDVKEIAMLKSRACGKDDSGKTVPFSFKSFFAECSRGRVSNWGTRGDAFNAEIIYNGRKKVSYSYLTATTPGETFLEKVSREYPNIKFDLEYFSLDAGHKGLVFYKNGKALQETEGLMEAK